MHILYFLAIILPACHTMLGNISNIIQRNSMADVMKVVESGIQLAMEHCRQEFKWQRWNCPESAFLRRGEQFVDREIAFVQGITASGVVYSITTACSNGDLDCGCSRYHRQNSDTDDFLWRRCSDNVKQGIEIADYYLDTRGEKSYIHNYVKMHNTYVGQQAVRNCLEVECKCYGMSGSCTTKVCWKQLCPFRKIVLDLRYRYNRAVRLNFVADDEMRNSVAISSDETKKIMTRQISSQHFVYSQNSPDYCHPDLETGWPGTMGRECSMEQGANVTSDERFSCHTLCTSCNYMVERSQVITPENCNCTFHWCCEVTCQICSSIHDVYNCAPQQNAWAVEG